MVAIREALLDLLDFALSALFPVLTKASSNAGSNPPPVSVLPVTEHSDDLVVTKDASQFKTVADVMAEHPTLLPPVHIASVGEVVMCKERTSLFLNPTKEFDGVIDTISPGKILRVDEVEGKWLLVAYENKKGWIQRNAAHEHEGAVHPYFVINEYCGPESENTVRLRSIIEDEFSGAETESPLRGEEYVYYQLIKRGLFLPMITQRPRTAGNWHKYFKGRSGVHISVRPKTGTVMEWLSDEEEGRIAYVAAVLPDESLNIQMIGEPEDGYYSEKTLSQEEWFELSPIFIQFS